MKSMTGYGKADHRDERINLSVEIVSVNSKYLDMNLNIPQEIRPLEPRVREIIRDRVKRGRIECNVNAQLEYEDAGRLSINKNLVSQFMNEVEGIKREFGIEDDVKIDNILQIPDVVDFERELTELPDWLEKIVISTLKEALDKVDKMRVKEGEQLKECLSDNVNSIQKTVLKIREEQDDVQQALQSAYRERVELLAGDIEIDGDRLAQEVVMLVEKSDITEELDRLDVHIKEFKNALDMEGCVGRRLDFLLQEMNREINTLNSKTSGLEVNKYGLETKLTIDKLREQVQNIE